MKNWTTLESVAFMKEKDIFKDQTCLQAWKMTFGENVWLWFVPIGGPRPEQGLDYMANIPVSGVITEQVPIEENEESKLV